MAWWLISFFFLIFIVIQLQLYAFSPLPSPPPQLNPPPSPTPNSFLFSTDSHSIVWMDHSLFIHSPAKGHLGCFQVLASYEQSCHTHSHADFCVNVSFWLTWVNTEEHGCCIAQWEYVGSRPSPVVPLTSSQQEFLLLHLLVSLCCCQCFGFWPFL